MASDPTHQFVIKPMVYLQIQGVDISFTNSALFMGLSAVTVCAFLIASTSGRGLVPSRWQAVSEMLYEFIATTLRDITGKEGMRFFPLVFSLFSFILLGNVFGLFPYFYTFTSQVVITFSLAMLVMAVVILYGLYHNGLKFLRIFVPSGIPFAALLLVVPIEIISFLSRPISLSLRLFANVLAGHITLKVFAGFILAMGSLGALGWVAALLPLVMVFGLTALECLVAFLQAYVFTILTCVYLNDALHPGH